MTTLADRPPKSRRSDSATSCCCRLCHTEHTETVNVYEHFTLQAVMTVFTSIRQKSVNSLSSFLTDHSKNLSNVRAGVKFLTVWFDMWSFTWIIIELFLFFVSPQVIHPSRGPTSGLYIKGCILFLSHSCSVTVIRSCAFTNRVHVCVSGGGGLESGTAGSVCVCAKERVSFSPHPSSGMGT